MHSSILSPMKTWTSDYISETNSCAPDYKTCWKFYKTVTMLTSRNNLRFSTRQGVKTLRIGKTDFSHTWTKWKIWDVVLTLYGNKFKTPTVRLHSCQYYNTLPLSETMRM